MRSRSLPRRTSRAPISEDTDLLFDAQPASVAGVRRAAISAAEAAGLPSEQIQGLHIAVGEAATNAIEHAYVEGRGNIRLRTYRRGLVFYAEITDYGRWREGAPRIMAGRGIPIMRALVDDFTIAREASGTTVRLGVRTG